MVRATAAEMLKLFGGTYPPGHDATSFGNFAAQTDAILDTKAIPSTLSATGTNEVAFANRVAVNLVLRALWLSAGGILSGQQQPSIWTNDDNDILAQLLADTTAGRYTTIDMIDEDD
jgi:muconolactone delta-isomerase